MNSYWQIVELFSTGQQRIWVWSFLNVFIFFWWWRHGLVSVLALYSLALFPERYPHPYFFFSSICMEAIETLTKIINSIFYEYKQLHTVPTSESLHLFYDFVNI